VLLCVCLELFVVLVLDAERAADIVHAILIRRRVVAAWRFVAYRVGVFPVSIHVAARHRRARLRMLALRLTQLGAAGARGRAVAIHVEARGRTGDGLLDFAQAPALALETGRAAKIAGHGGGPRGTAPS